MGCYGHPIVQTPHLDRLAHARQPLHRVLDAVAGLHPGARLVRHRQVHPPDRILGQRRSLRRLDPELASPAARGRPPDGVDRQAAFSLRRGGQRLFRSHHPDARRRQEGRPARPDPRRPAGARRRLQDGEDGRPRRIRLTRNTTATSPPAPRSGCTRRRGKHTDKPWVLFVSFVAPHYPLTAPPEHFYRYYNDPKLPMPLFYGENERPHHHPFIADYARGLQLRRLFQDAGRRAPRGRRLLRPVQLHGRAGRQGARRARKPRARRQYPRDLHQRPRRRASASAGCGASRRSTRRPSACR